MSGESNKKHLNITITGRVQGVGFRASTCRKAKKIGVAGFVRNEADGSVYIEAEGTEQELNKLLQWLQHGPRFARVDNVKKEEGTTKNYATLQIQR